MVVFSGYQAQLLGQYHTYLFIYPRLSSRFCCLGNNLVSRFLFCNNTRLSLPFVLPFEDPQTKVCTDPLITTCWLQDLQDWLFLTGRVFSALLTSCSWCAIAEPKPVPSPAVETKICKTSVSIKCPDRNSSIALCDWSDTGKNHSWIRIHVWDFVCLGWIHLGPVLSGRKYCSSFTEFGGANI